jgi:hypothetical protein
MQSPRPVFRPSMSRSSVARRRAVRRRRTFLAFVVVLALLGLWFARGAFTNNASSRAGGNGTGGPSGTQPGATTTNTPPAGNPIKHVVFLI